MDGSRTERLHQLLRRLGKAVHGSVVRSDEVRACLSELHDDGWRSVMLVETSLACDENGTVEAKAGTMRLHVDTEHESPDYRIDVVDASLLSSLGIAPGRHRSNGATTPRVRVEQDLDSES
ncbi:MAG: hypothetical protein E4H44_05730 [Candidatus Aminicenantes bacterium]|nr:MAG: hypothetical protein E4H44_05730 [Candidatus Aminicenantes bacterium]